MTLKDLKNDREITAIVSVSEEQIEMLGYTEHSIRHVSIVAKRAGELLKNWGTTSIPSNSRRSRDTCTISAIRSPASITRSRARSCPITF